MARPKRPGLLGQEHKDGPGLTFLLVALVVVAVVGAKFLGFSPPGNEEQPPPPAVEQPQENAVVGEKPFVVVYSAHPTENYSPSAAHAKGSGDILSVAGALAEALLTQDVDATFVGDGQLATWSQSFEAARASVEPVISSAGEVAAVVDVHRDALEGRPDGYTTISVNGESVAKIMLVVGDLENPYTEENLAFAEDLRAELETIAPGITRSVKTLHQSFNGDLCPRSVQVHIGEYTDNDIEEAMAAAQILAQAIGRVMWR